MSEHTHVSWHLFFIGEYDDYDDDGHDDDGYEQGKLICFIGHDQLSEFLSGITLRENKGYYSLREKVKRGDHRLQNHLGTSLNKKMGIIFCKISRE